MTCSVQLIIVLILLTYCKAQECRIDEDQRLDCHPDNGSTEETCKSRGCCWTKSNVNNNLTHGAPVCFFPSNYEGYKIDSISKNAFKLNVKLKRNKLSGLPRDVDKVNVDIIAISDSVCRIRVTDANNQRFEPQLPKLNLPPLKTPLQYSFNVDSRGILSVLQNETHKYVFATDLRQLIFSDQFIQLQSKLSTSYVYGLGEHKDSFLKKADWKVYTMFNKDQFPIYNSPLYGSHPFYLTINENNEHTSAVFVLNSNPMDIALTPAPSVVYRPIGGILDLFIFVGSSPQTVVADYIKLIGLPAMPPMWGLGFHLCRFGYNSLKRTIEVWNNTRNAKIPFDVQWNDIDYMDRYNDFTFNKSSFAGLPEFVDHLHKIGMHYDPGISAGEKRATYPPYDEGLRMDIFIKNNTGQPLIGKVWNKSGKTVFPDFTHPNASVYWTEQMKRYHSQVTFDGAWLDMNEISNFVEGSLYGCPKNNLEQPPYVPGNNKLQKNGLCMTAKHYAGLQYNVHNLYSTYETKVTNCALRKLRQNKRPFIISRSTFSGQGHYGGHWSGDVQSSFEDMRLSIPSILNFNMFGIPLVGADICGFNGNTTKELCARWMALGAFYPFARNHNSDDTIDQDPVSLGETVVEASLYALNLRYIFLPYLYTLFYRAHKYGETVARPLFFVYPNDKTARMIETQFLWGSALMIAPVVEEKEKEVNVYLPAGHWYSMLQDKLINSSGEFMRFAAPLNRINLFLRGGDIVVTGGKDTLQTSQLYEENNGFSIAAVLDSNGLAKGDFFWDDGESIDSIIQNKFNYVTLTAENNTLSIEPKVIGYEVKKYMISINIFGVFQKPTRVTVNGHSEDFYYDPFNSGIVVIFKTFRNIFSKYSVVWQ